MSSCVNRALVLSLLAGTASLASAQSVNVDINRTTGSGSGVPSSGYGAAAGQAGTWNNVPTTDSNGLALVGLNGASSGLTITTNLTGGSSSTSGSASTDYGRLMWDYADSCCFYQTSQDVKINGLNQGRYWLYVYQALPGSVGFFPDPFSGDPWYYGTSTSVYLANVSQGAVYTSGPVVADVYEAGVTHGRIPINVGAGAPELHLSIYPQYTNSDQNAKAAINGLQLVQFNASRIYVDINATGANTGASWADAMTSLPEALNAAKKWGVSEIYVADGTYRPGSARTQSFMIPSGVKIYGGWAGASAPLARRDPQANLTVLSGNIGNLFVNTDNSYQVVDASDTNSTTLIDGFRIVGGRADYQFNDTDKHGGGIYGNNCDATFRNCDIRSNFAALSGGGVYLEGDSDANFIDCTFYANTSDSDGGALAISSATAIVDAWNCKFVSNTSGDRGGAVYNESQLFRTVNCLYNFNSATGLGGAIYAIGSINPAATTITNCTFYRSTGATTGGVRVFNADATIRNSIFHFNPNTAVATNEAANLSFGGTGTHDVQYSWISGLTGGLGGTGNLGATGDPGFSDRFGPDNNLGTLDENFNLIAGSGTVDSGSNAALPFDTFDLDNDNVTLEFLPVDLDGKARSVDDRRKANAVVGSVVDMGAYERAECFFDFNGDGYVDDTDFVYFAQAYDAFATSAGDFNGDGFTDDTDFVYFAQAYDNYVCP